MKKTAATDNRSKFKQVYEYPVGGKPPMMTHIFKNEPGETIIAAKGAPEAILKRSNLSVTDLKKVEEQSLSYAKQGYRLLGVGNVIWEEEKYPESQ
jgi:Ca2+-transporting ATPase